MSYRGGKGPPGPRGTFFGLGLGKKSSLIPGDGEGWEVGATRAILKLAKGWVGRFVSVGDVWVKCSVAHPWRLSGQGPIARPQQASLYPQFTNG